MLELLFRLLGVPASVPGAIQPARELVEVGERLGARYNEAKPHLDAVMPHVPPLVDIGKRAWPDVETAIARVQVIAPAAHDLLDFIERFEGKGATTQQAVQHVKNALAQYHGGPKGQ